MATFYGKVAMSAASLFVKYHFRSLPSHLFVVSHQSGQAIKQNFIDLKIIVTDNPNVFPYGESALTDFRCQRNEFLPQIAAIDKENISFEYLKSFDIANFERNMVTRAK